MAAFGNQFSFLIAIVGVGLLVVLALWRWHRPHPLLRLALFAWYALGALTFALILRYPATPDVQRVEDVNAVLQNGNPTFVTLYSNYCLACVAALPAVRDLTAGLQNDGVDALLLDIHAQPANAMLERFAFSVSPTYILYDAEGDEVWRGNSTPTRDEVVSRAANGPQSSSTGR